MEYAPCGSWHSPITSDLIVAEAIGLGQPVLRAGNLYWLESRPSEGGRNVLVTRDNRGVARDLTPPPFNVRSRVHEYGGGAWWLSTNGIYFCNFTDQQIYYLNHAGHIQQLTHAAGLRFADGVVDEQRNRLICVVEDHRKGEGEPENFLGQVDLATGDVKSIASGHDFYSSPSLCPQGNQLAFITWDHPAMPWDETRLWEMELTTGSLIQVAGGKDEAVQQPRYHKNGTLYFISDRSDWWNLYRREHDGSISHLIKLQEEIGVAPWVFGASSYGWDQNKLYCIASRAGQSRLLSVTVAHDDAQADDIGQQEIRLDPIETPYTQFSGISVEQGVVALLGASPVTFSTIVLIRLEDRSVEPVKASCEVALEPGNLSIPEAITFPTSNGDVAYGYYYPPANCQFAPVEGERPPLLVELHGGPTSQTSCELNLRRQYWTSRGFGVLDLNYRGSTGYGRSYRDKLKSRWGIAEVDDCVCGAEYLVSKGLADADKLAIRGGSAGGYTALAALTFKNTFKAGASHYGIGDLLSLAGDTHKFEARYLDSLVGSYPEDIHVYQARSPINHIDQLSCPVIFFQGLEDQVVPPNQAEAMVSALKAKGIPVAYVPFEGEQHGFRKAENIKRAIDLEFYFYSRIFNFTAADSVEPVTIYNLDK